MMLLAYKPQIDQNACMQTCLNLLEAQKNSKTCLNLLEAQKFKATV